MTIKGFFKFVADRIGYKPKELSCIPVNSKLVVDAKNEMYKCAWGIPSTSTSFVDDLANAIASKYRKHVGNVLFVNDGDAPTHNLKLETSIQRGVQRAQRVKRLREETIVAQELEAQIPRLEPIPTYHTPEVPIQVCSELQGEPGEDKYEMPTQLAMQHDKVERLAKETRGISTETSKQVLLKLEEMGFQCLQCEGEADPMLAKLSTTFDFVVSEDGDMIGLYGIHNLLTHKKGCYFLFNANDFLAKANLTLEQMRWLSFIAGCDFIPSGIPGIGLATAYKLITTHHTLSGVLEALQSTKKPRVIPSDFEERCQRSMDVLTNQTSTGEDDTEEGLLHGLAQDEHGLEEELTGLGGGVGGGVGGGGRTCPSRCSTS